MEWRPIDTAPIDGTIVWLYCSDNVQREGWFETGRNFDQPFNDWTSGWETQGEYDVGYNSISPTHWMPLPEPPATEDKHA